MDFGPGTHPKYLSGHQCPVPRMLRLAVIGSAVDASLYSLVKQIHSISDQSDFYGLHFLSISQQRLEPVEAIGEFPHAPKPRFDFGLSPVAILHWTDASILEFRIGKRNGYLDMRLERRDPSAEVLQVVL
jgi:hypothetical protein